MEFLKILLKFACIFAAAPIFQKNWQIKKSQWYTCYAITTAAINVIIAIICVYYNPKLNFQKSLPTGVCLYYARYISFAVQLVTVNLSPIVHFDSWRQLVNNFLEIDSLLPKNVNNNNKHKSKYLIFFLINIPFILRVIMEEIIWNFTDGVAIHKFYFYMNFNRYYAFASNIVMLYINILLNKRFTCLNRLIKRVDSIQQIRNLTRIFILLTSVVKLYSRIFGLQIFFELLYMHMAMLQRLVGNLRNTAVATAVFNGNGMRIFQYLSLDGIIFNIV